MWFIITCHQLWTPLLILQFMAWSPSSMPSWAPCCPCWAWPNKTTWSGSSLQVRFINANHWGFDISCLSVLPDIIFPPVCFFPSSSESLQWKYPGVPRQPGQSSRSDGQERHILKWNPRCFWHPLQYLAAEQGVEGESTLDQCFERWCGSCHQIHFTSVFELHMVSVWHWIHTNSYIH